AGSSPESELPTLREHLVCSLKPSLPRQLREKEAPKAGPTGPTSWADLRQMDDAALARLARLLAARERLTELEALLARRSPALSEHWTAILNAVPETAEVASLQRLLPLPDDGRDGLIKVADATGWYLERAFRIVSRTGLCRVALELLQFGIHALLGVPWAVPSGELTAADLPDSAEVFDPGPLVQLCGLFRLVAEYHLYLQASYKEMLESGWPKDQPPPVQSLISLLDFAESRPADRAGLVLRSQQPKTVVEDVRRWLRATDLSHCDLEVLDVGLDGLAAPSSEERLRSAAQAAAGYSAEE
ncbi:nbas, partial [Symbiodinium sp. CCMP2456]